MKKRDVLWQCVCNSVYQTYVTLLLSNMIIFCAPFRMHQSILHACHGDGMEGRCSFRQNSRYYVKIDEISFKCGTFKGVKYSLL